MQPRAEEIHRILSNHIKMGPGESEATRRRGFALAVKGSKPIAAEIRDLRDRCAMVDIGSSIFTLAYADILGLDPLPSAEGGLRVTVRSGCFASHAAARLRRSAPRSWHSSSPSQPLARGDSAGANGISQSELEAELSLVGTSGGIAEGDPAGTGSARQESVGEDAVRVRRK